jgi:hypothetical protein
MPAEQRCRGVGDVLRAHQWPQCIVQLEQKAMSGNRPLELDFHRPSFVDIARGAGDDLDLAPIVPDGREDRL